MLVRSFISTDHVFNTLCVNILIILSIYNNCHLFLIQNKRKSFGRWPSTHHRALGHQVMLVCDVNSPDATTNRNQLNKKTLIWYILNAHKTIIENINVCLFIIRLPTLWIATTYWFLIQNKTYFTTHYVFCLIYFYNTFCFCLHYIIFNHNMVIKNKTNIPPLTTNKYAHNIGSFIQLVSLNQNIWFTFASYWVVNVEERWRCVSQKLF